MEKDYGRVKAYLTGRDRHSGEEGGFFPPEQG